VAEKMELVEGHRDTYGLNQSLRALGLSKSLFGKVHTPLASRFSIRRIMATSMKLSLLCTIRS
jgi:hypothetical protein